jgi:hypothetical protein
VSEPDKNWSFFISCKDCKATFELGEGLVSWSLEVLETGSRITVLTIPQQCPDCRNLRLVSQPEKSGDTP